MNDWKERDRYAFVLVATCAYITSLFLAWWRFTITGDSENPARTMRVDGLGGDFGSTNRLSELCVVIAVSILILSLAALRSDDHRLILALRHLAKALVVFNALSVLELWRAIAGTFSAPDFYRDSHIAYGAYVAIGTSVLVLFSVLVLDAGSVRALLARRREDAPKPPPSS